MKENLNYIRVINCKKHAYQYHYYDTYVNKYSCIDGAMFLLDTFIKGETELSPFTAEARKDETQEVECWRLVEHRKPDIEEFKHVNYHRLKAVVSLEESL